VPRSHCPRRVLRHRWYTLHRSVQAAIVCVVACALRKLAGFVFECTKRSSSSCHFVCTFALISHSLALTRTHSRPPALTRTHPHSLALTCTHLTHSHSLAPTRTHSHSLALAQLVRSPGNATIAPGPEACCNQCVATAKCTSWQWNYANNTYTPKVCYLISGPRPAIKTPVHPAQKLCTVSAPPPPPPLPPAPPGAVSVLYVLVDDLRTQMGAYGHEFMKTPNLDTFAESAVVFEQAHCNSQMCVPTRTFFASFPSLRPACTDGGVDNRARAHRLVCVCGA
jgi:hypothetical protein